MSVIYVSGVFRFFFIVFSEKLLTALTGLATCSDERESFSLRDIHTYKHTHGRDEDGDGDNDDGDDHYVCASIWVHLYGCIYIDIYVCVLVVATIDCPAIRACLPTHISRIQSYTHLLLINATIITDTHTHTHTRTRTRASRWWQGRQRQCKRTRCVAADLHIGVC